MTLTSAIVDTAATWCLFTPDVFRALELSPFDEALVSTTSSANHFHDLYNVELDFSGHRITNVSALDSPNLSIAGVQGLIGRNVLSRAVFYYDGPRNRYSLSF